MSDRPFDPIYSEDPATQRNQQEHAELEAQLQDVQTRQRAGAARINEMDLALQRHSDQLTEAILEQMRGIRERVDDVADQLHNHMQTEHAEFREVHQAWTQAKGMGKLAVWLFAVFSTLLAGLAWAYEHWQRIIGK